MMVAFLGREFVIPPEVYIVRSESSFVVKAALQVIRGLGTSEPRIAEIGTGCGALAITIKLELPKARLLATDVCPEAIQAAQANAARHGVEIELAIGHLYEPLQSRPPFDLIVSVPPYLPKDQAIAAAAKSGEPLHAYDGGPTGTALVRSLVAGAPPFLTHGGALLLQAGADQMIEAMAVAVRTPGYQSPKVVHNRDELPNVFVARRG